MSFAVFLLLMLALLVVSGLRIVPERERLAIVRLERYVGIRGPGLVWTLPVLDRIVRVQLDRDLPHWRALTADQLAEEVRRWLFNTRRAG
jgi:regulator of protease activity HflC (stomatin/prohibitin superfamily)